MLTQAATEEWMARGMRNPDLIRQGRDNDGKKIDYRKLDVFSLALILFFVWILWIIQIQSLLE